MRRFVTLNCLVDKVDAEPFPSDAIQSLRRTLLAPIAYKPMLQEALKHVNFKFHRTCSFYNIIQDCNVCEGETLLMFWGRERSESRMTMSVSASSCSSVVMPIAPANVQQREKELCTTGQQTEISCRPPRISSPRISSPGTLGAEIELILAGRMNSSGSPLETEDHRQFRARIADSLTVSSPASSLLQPTGRSMSILGSVCALLLNKQQSVPTPKEVTSFTESVHSEHICRICFGGESSERLVRPCSCRGTIAAVHRSCLERWLLQAASSYCELCRHHYLVTRTHKWSWLRSVYEWARSGRGRSLAADACRGAALCAGGVVGTARALHAADAVLQAGARRGGGAALAANLFSSLLIGIIGALNGLLTTWMLLKIQEHQASWQAWRASTLHVHVTLSEAASDATVVAAPDGTVTAAPDATTVVAPEATTVVAPDAGGTAERGTNVADPFMVAMPFRQPEP